MDSKKIINGLIAAGNRYDIDEYLSYYLPDAILDDPSAGRKFTGHKGIRNYFVNCICQGRPDTLANIQCLKILFTKTFSTKRATHKG